MTTYLPADSNFPMSLADDIPLIKTPQDDATDTPLQEPTGAASEFGLPLTSTGFKKDGRWNRQEMVLAAFRACGRIGEACRTAGLTRWAALKWQEGDIYGFNTRLKQAHADYCEENIHRVITERISNPQGNRGSDILLMFHAKAEQPEKYRELPVSDHGALAQGLSVLMQLGRLSQSAAPKLQAPSTDAAVRDLPADTETPR